MAHHSISIGKKKVGPGNPVFIIAEAGVNHNGKLSLAKKLIDVAASAGADAVKFQTFAPDMVVTKSAAKADYQITNEPAKKETHYELLKRVMLKRDYHQELKEYAEKKKIIFLSTAFSLDDAEFLKALKVPALKIASCDTNNYPFLSILGGWKIPIILSTGMADMAEVREAVRTLRRAGNTELVLLQCTTNYPIPFSEANLRVIQTFKKEFNLPVGLSDHTVGIEASIAAVALGASVIEKHFTLDKNLSGPDHKASLEPDELCKLVEGIRNVEKALGTGKKVPFPSEKKIINVARKSVVTKKNIKKGELFCNEYNITVKRPGTGLSPSYLKKIDGKKAARNIPADTVITKRDYEA